MKTSGFEMDTGWAKAKSFCPWHVILKSSSSRLGTYQGQKYLIFAHKTAFKTNIVNVCGILFIQHESHEVACILEIAICSSFDTKINCKDYELL